MPNPHYQRVLEQDQSLPAPLRWLSRAMCSWWAIGGLSVFVVGYVFFAHAPVLGKYIWQWRIFDTTQHAVLTWWPLLVAAWLLAAVLLWSAMRRLPWRTDNLGAFVAVLGLVVILISQSWAFRSQSIGIAAVPISESTGNAQADALTLSYTTRYGDTHDRVLVVMARGAAPITIPLDHLPRWNDAAGDRMPKLKLHDHPRLSGIIGYGTRITTTAYIAEGELKENDDGTQSADAIKERERNLTALPYPAKALLAIDITTDLEDGSTKTTTAWLPFEPQGTDALVPERFYNVEGLGSVGLAFRPASKKLPFALAAAPPAYPEKWFQLTLMISDTDEHGRLLKPDIHEFSGLDMSATTNYQTLNEQGRPQTYKLSCLNRYEDKADALIAVSTGTSNPFILAGMITFALGVFLDRLLDWLGSRPSKPKATSKGKSPISSATP